MRSVFLRWRTECRKQRLGLGNGPKSAPISKMIALNKSDAMVPHPDDWGRNKQVTAKRGALIINADDWGRDRKTTQSIHDCVVRKTISSASAMVFMEDSERAAQLSRECGVDLGLHLNFTTPFTARECPQTLVELHRKVAAYLRSTSLARVLFHPGLTKAFEYVVASQIDEYQRLYGCNPDRLDGHHHMHLSSNVLFAKLLPEGTIVRRSFTFQSGEKSALNRMYRRIVDRKLAHRHRLTDFFFSLVPLEPPARLQRILSLATSHTIEIETHPVNPREYDYLMGEEMLAVESKRGNRRSILHSKVSYC